MKKNHKKLSVVLAAIVVAIIPILLSSFGAATAYYGPFGAYNVIVKKDYNQDSSMVEGRVAVGNNISISGEEARLASGYNPDTVLGYFLQTNEYPSLVVQNAIELQNEVAVTDGAVIGAIINDEQLLNFEGADFSYVQDDTNKLSEGFEYFNQEADNVINQLMGLVPDDTDPNTYQNYNSHYDIDDKNLIIMDLVSTIDSGIDVASEGSESETATNGEVPEESSELVSETASELELAEPKTSVTINQIDVGTLQSHEHIVIRSDAQYIDFENTNITYEGDEVLIDVLDNLDENAERLAGKLVWVFPNAVEVNMNNADIVGSILAPEATVTQTSGTLAGQLYANNFIQQDNGYVVNRINFAQEYEFHQEVESSQITIEFLDQDNMEIYDDIILKRQVGTTFMMKLPVIEGYALDASSNDAYDLITTGFSVTAEDEIFTLKYNQLYSSILTVNHVLLDGTNIVDPIISHPEIGTSYTTEPLNDPEYQLLETPVNASGTMSKKVDVTYVYALYGDARTINIRHVDENGDDLITSSNLSVGIGETYDVSNYIIKNNIYQYVGLYSGSAPLTGVAESDITVILEYHAVTTCSQFGESTSGANADTLFDISEKNQATRNELQFNEIQGKALVEEQGSAVSSTGINLGTEYSTESTNNVFMDYRYSFNTNENYDNFIPVRQEGPFEPITIVATDSGNAYDIRARTSASGLTTYTSGGINYQKKLASLGYQSLMIRFEECQAIVSFNSGSTAINGTQVMTFDYTDFTFLDESLAGYTFDWDATNNQLTVNIVFEKDGKLEYSGNSFTIDLNDSKYKGFMPQDYALTYKDTANTKTKLYKPFTSTDRYMYEVIGLQSPHIDTTNTKFTTNQAMNKNMIYGISTVNGKVNDYSQIADSSKISEWTMPYNPNGYARMVSTAFANKTSDVFGYVVADEYSPVEGTTLKAETGIVYGKNKHPKYSMAATAADIAIIEGRYSSLEQIPSLDVVTEVYEDGETITTGDAVENINFVIIDESNVDFNQQGSYTALGYAQTRDIATGEQINAFAQINVTVTGAILDYGDAPETYGEAGAKVGNSKYRFNIGINRNGNRQTHADAEAEPLYSADARGDETTGMADETGWFNMDPNGIGELNIEMEKMRISFPYTATGTARVGFWIDFNQNGEFEDFEGKIVNVNRSSYDAYGMVNFDIDLSPEFSTLEAGESTFARVRIISGNSLGVEDAAETFDDKYGETEDFMVNLYGKKNEYQICTQVLANTPIVTVKNVSKVSNAGPDGDETGVKYVFDIGDANPNSNSSNSFYPDVQVTVTSKQGIVSNTKAGEPAYFRVEQSASPYESPANTIHIQSRNKAGEPINLPFTFSFWDLDDFTGSNVVESVSIGKDSVYLEGVAKEDIKTTADSVGMVEDFGTYLKIFTTRQVETEPEGMFIMQGTSLAKADIEIVEEARLLEIGMGLDLGQMDKVIEECVDPYGPKAQIEILGEFYDDEVSIYNNYPFAYQSTNIPFPYFPNLNSVTQNLYIPDGVEFVDGNTDVTIYRRDLLGSRTENDWQLVDPSLYTQTLDTVNNISSVKFDNPVANRTYGYEYRMEYNFEISEDMHTGQRIVFKSDFEYNKGKTSENTEVYHLNDVTAIVKEAFTSDINTIMGDETVHVESTSNSIYYTYEYLNCDTCDSVTEPTLLSGDITIPIPDKEDMDFYSEENFDMYEDIKFTLYDNEMKVFEFPVRRWYPTKLKVDIDDVTELTQITDGLNPVGQTIQIRAAYKQFTGFDKPVHTYYSQESINIQRDATVNQLENSILELDDLSASISTEPTEQVPASWGQGVGQEFDGSDFMIEVDDLVPVFDASIVYVVPEEQICTGEEQEGTECLPQGYHAINIEAGALDETLETAKVTKDGKDYKTILFKDSYSVSEDGSVNLSSTLDNRYMIEAYSGRIYNKYINRECKLESQVDEDYTGLYCYDDTINNYQIATTDIEKILAGYNDAADADKTISSTINGIPLAEDLEKGDVFNYLIYLSEFGRNETEITIADRLEIETTPIEYYNDEGTFYFKRTTPTDEEVKCIKNDTCGAEYQQVLSGTIDNTFEIKNQMKDDTSLIESYKSLNKWLDEYVS